MKFNLFSKTNKLTLIALFGNMIAAILNYLFHFLSGKILSVNNFGQLESFIGLFAITSVLTGAIGPVIINQITHNSPKKISSIILFFQNKLIAMSFVLTLILSIGYPVFNSILKNENFFIYLLFLIQIISSFYLIFYQSILQAQFKIFTFLLLGIFFSLSKIFFIFIFFHLGFSDIVSNLSLSLSYAFTAIISAIIINRQLSKNTAKQFSVSLKKLASFSFLSLVTNFFLTIIINQDTIIARYFLSESSAGSYAAISLVSKIIFFFSTAILIVYYPLFNQNDNKRHLNKLLLTGMMFIVLVCAGFVLIYSLYPSLILSLLFGTKFIAAANMLPLLSIFMFFLSIFYFLIQFLLSQQNSSSAFVSGITVLTQTILILFYHQSLTNIIYSMMVPIIPAIVFSWYYSKQIIKIKHYNY
ncbi:MAG: hypothetical protein Q8P53_01625 [Candidatus Shapirobacteria bacterium]|nr:hypothetical protein [Candidatus Shapirobacteria bacterium]